MSTAAAGDWCLIESDPGVFSELIRGFGVTGIQVEELYSLDDESFAPLKPILGLVFLFKIDESYQAASEDSGSLVQDSRLDTIFFAKQVINNACATQAILNLLMNATENPSVNLGDILTNFKDFTKSFDSQTKGLAISNQEELRKVHNSFARHAIFELEDFKSSKDEDMFHFVGYLPVNGRLYEFDGLREGPLDHGAVGEDWLTTAREVIQKRIEKYANNEIRFNLMALITDRRMKYEQDIAALHASASDGSLSEDQVIELARLQSMFDAETCKLQQYRLDNIRRRHNYMPLIVNLLQVLAEQDKLTAFYQTAQRRSAEIRKAATQAASQGERGEKVV